MIEKINISELDHSEILKRQMIDVLLRNQDTSCNSGHIKQFEKKDGQICC